MPETQSGATSTASNGLRSQLTEAHTGLRGLLAVHVAVFHYLAIKPISINVFGHADMPFFFLLSGFSLAMLYGRTEPLNHFAFWRNRFARLAAPYYVWQIGSALLVPLGHGHHPSKVPGAALSTVMATSMWLPKDGEPTWSFCGPAWTVSTLAFWYWLFPLIRIPSREAWKTPVGVKARLITGILTCLCTLHGLHGALTTPVESQGSGPLRVAQPPSQAAIAAAVAASLATGLAAGTGLGTSPADAAGTQWLALIAWLQFAVGVALGWGGLPYVGKGYWPATGWPLSRLPVFVMGCIAGLMLPPDQAGAHRAGTWWGRVQLDDTGWGKKTDRAAGLYVGALLLCGVLTTGWGEQLKGKVDLGLTLGILSQLTVPYVQLLIIVGLASSSKSVTARICHSPAAKFLGKISMGIYLSHMPLYHLATALEKGVAEWPQVDDIDEWRKACHLHRGEQDADPECRTFSDARMLSPQWLPLVLLASLLVSWAAERVVEAPARALLRAKPAACPAWLPQSPGKQKGG